MLQAFSDFNFLTENPPCFMQELTSNIPSVSVEVGSASEDSSLCEFGTASADGNVINQSKTLCIRNG